MIRPCLFLVALFILWLPATVAAGNPRLIATGTIPAETTDQLGETIGGIGSGAVWMPDGTDCLLTSDRGAGDGTIDFRPRFHRVRLQAKDGGLVITIQATVLYRDPQGGPMTGRIPEGADAGHPALKDGRWCIDPEAIACGPNATVFVSDEYGPFLYRFDSAGRMIEAIQPPAHYLPRTAGDRIDFAAAGDALVVGRLPNRGFEGLTLTPDGKRAVLALQNALAQDGGKGCPFTRLLVIDLVSGKPVAEFAYRFDDVDAINHAAGLKDKARLKPAHLGVTEIAALSDHEFLVLERDDRGEDGSGTAKPPVHKRIQCIDVSAATNLLELPGRPFSRLPGEQGFARLDATAKIVPARKRPFLDILAAAQRAFPCVAEKWEAIALTPQDAAGRRRILVGCDNDFLCPQLRIGGATLSFERAKVTVPSQFLLFEIGGR